MDSCNKLLNLHEAAWKDNSFTPTWWISVQMDINKFDIL